MEHTHRAHADARPTLTICHAAWDELPTAGFVGSSAGVTCGRQSMPRGVHMTWVCVGGGEGVVRAREG
jgi:hypothetical protein